MLQLSRHIELLLAENDCVVIPGFGGFITHEMPAVWNRKENIFFPPTRTLGFNPQLKMNDGLLVQSYMKILGNSYAEASDALDKEVKKITETLRREGKIEFPHIGNLSYLADNRYDFSPYENQLLSPSYYGLDYLEIKELATLIEENIVTEKRKKRKISYPLFINPLLRNTAAVAAVLILFFFIMSTPIENTYVEEENYAYLLPTELFNKIKKESLLTTPVTTKTGIETNANIITGTEQSGVKPLATKEVRVPQPEVKETAPVAEANTAEHKFHLIVASVTKESEGLVMVEKLHSKGYKQARIVSGEGRVRVSIASYATSEEAKKELLELRKIDAYQNAWLLTQK